MSIFTSVSCHPCYVACYVTRVAPYHSRVCLCATLQGQWRIRGFVPTLYLVVRRRLVYAHTMSQNSSSITHVQRFTLRHGPKITAIVSWIVLLGVVHYYRVSHELSLLDILVASVEFVASTIWGPLLYILIYALRPLLLVPAAPLTAFSGAVFGIGWGLLYTLVAANLSANVAYWIGRFFNFNLPRAGVVVRRWVTALQTRSFAAVLLMRLFYVPFDLTNYGAGILKIRWTPYFLATAIGIVPGVAMFVSLGASLDLAALQADGLRIGLFEPKYLALSVIIFIGSVALPRFVRRRAVMHD